MQRIILTFTILVLLLSGCASPQAPADAPTDAGLVVSGAETSKTYTQAALEALPATEAAFRDVNYRGVSLSTLLKDAGYDLAQVKAVKAVAGDGFTVNYDASQFQREDFLVAYARTDGALTAEDGAFRIVLPGEEGKLNVRMLAELQIIP